MEYRKLVIEIDEATLAKTRNCSKAFACLDNPNDICCTVVRVLFEQAYYVRYKHGYQCDHVVSSDGIAACICPVRKEIYRRYKI